jgi:MarR family transcriptional regulator, lower aerobic nicotinate degradation pathway regulator
MQPPTVGIREATNIKLPERQVEPKVAMPIGLAQQARTVTYPRLPIMTTSPGYLIRRAQQIHVSLWQKHVVQDLTSVQYGILLVAAQRRAVDQTTIGGLMSLDKNTVADVLRRLRTRKLVARERDPDDGRRWLTRLTDKGRSTLLRAAPAVVLVQGHMLHPLDRVERQTAARLLSLVAYRGDDPNTASKLAVPGWPPGLPALQLHTAPGHLVRRSQQLHTLLWTQEVSTEMTSVQYSVLLVLHRESLTDQVALSRGAGLDKATGADVVTRLHDRGLILRKRDHTDGRRYQLRLSANGLKVLRVHAEAVKKVQRRLMKPLSAAERRKFVALMTKVVEAARGD